MNKLQKRIFISSYTGNFLEVYDFVLCGILISLFGDIFFPYENGTLISSLILLLSCFLRPFGGYIIGKIGDTYGRKHGIFISILGMGVSTLMLALLPTHDSIGIWASVFFTLIRFSQAFFMGGEGPGAVVFLIEHLGSLGKTKIGGIFATSNGVGIVMASFSAFLIYSSNDPHSSWRIAFFIGSSIGLIAMFIRKFLPETDAFKSIKTNTMLPLKHFRNKTPEILVAFILSAIGGSITYFNAAYLPSLLKNIISTTPSESLFISTSFNLFTVFLTATFAFLFQKKNITHTMLMVGVLLGIILPLPSYYALISESLVIKTFSVFLFALPIACIASSLYSVIFSLFETKERYMLSALCINLGSGTFAGMQPLINTQITKYTGDPMAPIFFLIFLSTMAFIALSFSKLKKIFWRHHKPIATTRKNVTQVI